MKYWILIIFIFLFSENIKSNSLFIEQELLDQFKLIPSENKKIICGTNNDLNFRIIDKNLPLEIKGYNSRMDNRDRVKGSYAQEVAFEFNKAILNAFINNDEILKEKLLDKIYQWAKNDSLTKTKVCYRRNPNDKVVDACDTHWSDTEGQDPSPLMDAGATLDIIFSLSYNYYFFLKNYKGDDPRHSKIKDWFNIFSTRFPPIDQFYWGNQMGWSVPNIHFRYQNEKSYKGMVVKLIQGADKGLLKDGSIKDRTTRGNRALWYHFHGLHEAFMAYEIALATGAEIPDGYESKLLMAVEIFQKAFQDNSYITPWAKKRHNSQFDKNNPHYQRFNENLDSLSMGWWMYAMIYRFPDHPSSAFFKNELTPKSKSIKSDDVWGIGLGCIFKSLSNKDANIDTLLKETQSNCTPARKLVYKEGTNIPEWREVCE